MTIAPRNRNTSLSRRKARPRLESLEPRLVLSASASLTTALRGGDATTRDAVVTRVGNSIHGAVTMESAQHRRGSVKSLGAIQVAPSVSGSALRVLGGSYTFVPLQGSGSAIVSAASLRRPKIVSLLESDYASGQTVALANATAASAAKLENMLGVPNPPVFTQDLRQVPLLAFRKTDESGPAIFTTSILRPTVAGTDAPVKTLVGRMAAKRSVDQAISSFLDRVFSATPATLTPPPTLGDSVDLNSIANAYQMSQLYPINDGAAQQLNNTVYDIRSFSSAQDFYLTLQELDVQNGTDPFTAVGAFSYLNAAFEPPDKFVPLLSNPTLLQPSPQSNPATVSYTNSSSVTVGGSIGVNESQGLNAQLNASVSVSNSQTVTVPPITIAYRGDLLKASPNWAYFFRDTPTPGDSTSFYDQWIWRTPFSSYPNLSIPSEPNANQNVLVVSYAYYETTKDPNVHNWPMAQLVPKPFLDTYQLGAPDITDVSPLRVFAGSKFTITGFDFYPSLVQGILVGGVAVPSSNYQVDNNNQITVVAPNTPGQGLPIIVKTTQGFSNTDFKITILPAPVLQVQAQSFSAVAGQALTKQTVAILTDPGSSGDPNEYGTSINWGDGSTSIGTIIDAGDGTFKIVGTHTYLAAGTYKFTVDVSKGAVFVSDTGTATVTGGHDDTGGPKDLVTRPVTAKTGQPFSDVTLATFTDSDPGVSPTDFTAAVTWGDGTSTPSTTVTLAGPGTFSVLGTHTYLAAGTYTYNVQVTDTKGRKATANGKATVNS